jgi:prepilin peptidase CpaA
MLVGAALLVSVAAGWLDWRSRRIPNWLTVPALILGLGANTIIFGWPGAKTSLAGAGLALGLLLPVVLVRGLGAGDWKLMGALGALLGPWKLIVVMLGTVLIAGIMSLVEILRHGQLKQTLKNIWTLLLIIATFGNRSIRDSREQITLDNPGLLAVPFGVATALSMIVFVCWLSAVVVSA